MVTLSQAADDAIYNWAKKLTQLKDGQVVFQTDMGMTVLRINFTNGYCVHLSRKIGATIGTKTSMLITVESIDMNGVTHDNAWVK